MSRQRKPWSRAKVRRVLESTFVGGYGAYRRRNGWDLQFSGCGAGSGGRRLFIPARSLAEHSPAWLKNIMLAGMRQAIEELRGVTTISGREAQALTRWCVRYARSPKPELTASQRARIAESKRSWRQLDVPLEMHGGGYEALRSRRGWVIKLSSMSGPLRGRYLVPFRAFGPRTRTWRGGAIFAELERRMMEVSG